MVLMPGQSERFERMHGSRYGQPITDDTLITDVDFRLVSF